LWVGVLGEKLILEVTEALSEAIEKPGLTRSEVAKRLGKTKGFVSQLLAGGRNLTLRTVADIADAIGISLKVAVQGAESRRARPVRDAWISRRRLRLADG
jgi:transcriptional regulator with XRE-family HTH domain